MYLWLGTVHDLYFVVILLSEDVILTIFFFFFFSEYSLFSYIMDQFIYLFHLRDKIVKYYHPLLLCKKIPPAWYSAICPTFIRKKIQER